jgi:hypothetical protein
MINRTLKESLRNAVAEFDNIQSKKDSYVNSRKVLNNYLAAIDEMDELTDNGETLEEAFNGTFMPNRELYKFLTPYFKKYAK